MAGSRLHAPGTARAVEHAWVMVRRELAHLDDTDPRGVVLAELVDVLGHARRVVAAAEDDDWRREEAGRLLAAARRLAEACAPGPGGRCRPVIVAGPW